MKTSIKGDVFNMNPWNQRQQNNMQIVRQMPSEQIIVASKFGDVTGDGYVDAIFLIATKESDSAFLRNITLVVRDGRTNIVSFIPLQENAGYEPSIWLGDFTGDGINDIFITIQSGGSGGIIFAYIYSYQSGKIYSIFDSIKFNEQHQFKVTFENQYKVFVESVTPPRKYTIDLLYKGEEYLNEIYHPDGTLKRPIEGWVDPIGALYPIQYGYTNKYSLLAMQQIAGIAHVDNLGYVESLLVWNGKQFKVERQTVAIYGEDLSMINS